MSKYLKQLLSKPFVRTAVSYAFVLFIVAFGLGCLGFKLSALGHPFASNLLVNICAGLIALTVGLVVTAQFASNVARRNLDEFALRLLSPIYELRKQDKINPEMTRSLVISAVALLSADHLDMARENQTSAGISESCGLCSLRTEAIGKGEALRCKYCGLRGSAWKAAVVLPSGGNKVVAE